MGWGKLNDEQRNALRKHLNGKIVYDIGAGDTSLSAELVLLGASHVVAIDRMTPPENLPYRVSYWQISFQDLIAINGSLENQVCFVSFPPNNPISSVITKLIEKAPLVIYLGDNQYPTACGNEVFFRHLLTRTLHSETSGENTLLILGAVQDGTREPTLEEHAALNG